MSKIAAVGNNNQMQPNEHDFNAPLSDDETPSRSARRREALDVLKLAQRLVELSGAQLDALPVDETLREEIERARAVKQQIAHKRQVQFLAKQMRKLDDEALTAIRTALERDKDHSRRETAALHRIELWRARLVDEGDDALDAYLGEHPKADRTRLRQLMRQARAERDASRPPHAYRELFRALREESNEGDD